MLNNHAHLIYVSALCDDVSYTMSTYVFQATMQRRWACNRNQKSFSLNINDDH